MIMLRIGLASAIAMAAAMAGGSAQARPAAAQSPPGYTMPATQTWDMTADSGKSYRIFVSFPRAGKPPETGYPVPYVLDGNASFAPFAATPPIQAYYNIGTSTFASAPTPPPTHTPN